MATRKSTPRSTARKPATRKGRPTWLLLAVGIVIGLGIAGLAYLAGIKAPADKPAVAAPPAVKTTGKPATKAPAPAADSPDYTFYTVLPRNEVRVADDSQKTTPAVVAGETYVLQVGSFRQLADADRRRAELILMGLDTTVEKVTFDSGETWHRVFVGPFDSQGKAAEARQTLSGNRIDSMLLKRRSGG